MAGIALAEAFVRIRPDSTGFRVEADSQIKAALAGENPEVSVGANTKAAKLAIADLRAYVDALASKIWTLRMTADDKSLQATLARDYAQLLALDKFVASPEIDVMGVTKAQASLLGLDAGLDKIAHTVATARVGIDDTDTEKRLALLDVQLMDLTARAHDIRLGVTDPGGIAAIDQLQRKLDELRSKVVSVGFLETSGSSADAMRQILMLKRVMQTVGLADFLDVNLKPAQILSQLVILKQRIAAANLQDTLGINIDQTQLQEQIASIEAELNALPDVSLGVQVSGLGGAAAEVTALQAALSQISAGNAEGALATLAMDATALMGAAGGAGNGGGGGSGLLGAAAAGGYFGNALNTLHNHLVITGGGWTGLIGGVAAWHVALDAVIEATISLTLALVAMGAGIAPIAESAMDVGEHLLAVDQAAAALGVNIPPLTGKLDDLAAAMAPQAIELYGAGLRIVTSQSGALLNAAGPVVTLFDDWAAKLTVWIQQQGEAGQLLKAGTGYLTQFGQIIGTLGEALGNLLKEDPGIAHYLLDIVQAAASLLRAFTLLPAPLVAAVLGLHGLYVWGSVLGAVLQRVGIFAANTAKNLAGLAANPLFWVAAAAAALAYMAYQSTQADSATKKFISDLNAGLANEKASTAIDQIATDLGRINAQIQATTTTQVLKGWGSSWQAVGLDAQATGAQMQQAASDWVGVVKSGFTSLSAWKNLVDSVGNSFKDLFVPGAGASIVVKNDIDALNQEMIKLQGNEVNLFKETGNLTNQGYTYAQALSLMDLAGVRVGDSMAVMQAKIANLLQGYKSLGLQGVDLANTVNAVTFAMLQQNEKVQQVNAGWDAFENTIQGGETNMFKFANTLNNLNGSLGKGADAVKNLSGAQRQSLQYFSAAAAQANTYMDSLTTLANAAGLGENGVTMLDRATQDLVASMLPAAKNSTLLTAELYALAQRGGYQGADSFKALQQWVSSVQNPMKELDQITTTFTVHAGNLTKDVQNLSIALGTTLNQAMATAAFDASNGQKTFDAFAKAIETTTFDSQQDQKTALQLALSLQKLTGNTTDTKNEFISFAQDALHLTQQQADELWQQTFPKLQNSINNLQGKNIPITATASGSGTIQVASHPGNFLPHGIATLGFHAEGGKIGGNGLPRADDQLAHVSSGEWVMPVDSVRYYGPGFMAAVQKRLFAGAPGGARGMWSGFAAGGPVGADPWNNKIKDNFALFSQWEAANASQFGVAAEKSFSSAVFQWFQNAIAAAAKKFLASSGGYAGPGGGAPAANAALARKLAPYWGTGAEWAAWNNVAMAESGWNQYATNPGSGAYGIPQALPFTKMPKAAWPASAGGSSNPTAQITWMISYIKGQYGDPIGAWAHELAHHWYGMGGPVVMDNGGWLKPGMNHVWNGTGAPEKVTPKGAAVPVQLEFAGRKPSHPLESAVWDWIVSNVRVKGGGNVQLAMGTSG